MNADQKLNLMIDIDQVLNAFERAMADGFEIERRPDSCDAEEQRDIDNAKQEVAVRKELIRVRLLHKVLSVAREKLIIAPEDEAP